ncbi:MAG: hypothetical protein MUO21_00195, partial [Nitrososphaeraceae archaeon]|nr:hypothetical protein [Nitrososphaeraceae archaeon]
GRLPRTSFLDQTFSTGNRQIMNYIIKTFRQFNCHSRTYSEIRLDYCSDYDKSSGDPLIG